MTTRDSLAALLRESQSWGPVAQADHIIDRFDVNPKPVVTEAELGVMVAEASNKAFDIVGVHYRLAGRRMFDQLDAAGLRLGRVDDGA